MREKSGLPSLTTVALFLALVAPVFWFVYSNQDSPLFGYPHDDGLYYASAKSLHDGKGYRIASLPGEPFQTKYPPGLPAYLSLAWALNPEFPSNLIQASWLQFLWMPALLALSLWHWLDWGFTGWRRWVLATILATNAYILYFTATLMSELPFTVLVLLSLMFVRKAEKQPSSAVNWIAAAGLAAGLAFLMRTAGVVLLLGVPAILWWRGQKKIAAVYAATMLPAVGGWFVWTRLHQAPGTDPITLYYTNYVGYHFSVFHLNEAHLFLWRNFDGLLAAVGGLIFPAILPGQVAHITVQVVGVAAIAGIVRMARKQIALHYAIFGVLASLMIIVWSFPPNERFVLPVAPLIWAGFLTEVLHLAGGIRNKLKDKDTGQRIAAALIGLVGLGLILYAAKLQWQVRFEMFPSLAADERQRLNRDREAYNWIRASIPGESSLQSGYDTVLYLHTGHKAASLIPPVNFFYREDEDGRIEYLSHAATLSKKAGLEYILLSPSDYRNDMETSRKQELIGRIAKSPDLELLKVFPSGALFRIK